MGSLLQIRDVPDESRRELKSRAAARGQSLNAYLLELIDREVSRPTVAEVLDRAARRSERATASAQEVVATARADRDGDVGRRSA
ncbi:antitoxin [Nocardioides sp. YIM 152588]|uniref:FitA-like ribbon-helix-helix domain-containing protein n=1 Tax=Nocardioides sp. YIM 152588 TaxID=3158259 RepID=UPI0032E383DA